MLLFQSENPEYACHIRSDYNLSLIEIIKIYTAFQYLNQIFFHVSESLKNKFIQNTYNNLNIRYIKLFAINSTENNFRLLMQFLFQQGAQKG